MKLNTNVAGLTAQANMASNNRNVTSSLEKLSSGLRINKSADDASGMTIANSLRSQSLGLQQSMRNANDGINIVQIADSAMNEQIKILDTIKVKATQSAQGGQNSDSRMALQQDIEKLLKELDNIAQTTSYNGISLLSGQFTNKSFQIGSYSNETIDFSVGATSSDKIGSTRFETTSTITGSGSVKLTFNNVDGVNDYTLESVVISTSAGTGLGRLSEVINKNSNLLNGIKSTFTVQSNGSSAITTGTITGLTINDINIGDITIEDKNDSNAALTSAINSKSDFTGVVASVDSRGQLVLNSNDGRAIQISGTNLSSLTSIGSGDKNFNAGRITLTRMGGGDISLSSDNADVTSAINGSAEKTVNLRDMMNTIDADLASAMGFNANSNVLNVDSTSRGVGVSTLEGSMAFMSIADSARQNLDKIRAGLGSTQNQFSSTINNISVTQVNVAAAESQIRDVDFAQETANFSKLNIIAQASSYALSQANTMQQNILRLLQ